MLLIGSLQTKCLNAVVSKGYKDHDDLVKDFDIVNDMGINTMDLENSVKW